MTEKRIHIVAFDVPFPADYGGVIDIYYRIRALYTLGYKITLHCFEYGRSRQQHLETITDQVIYYSRQKTIWNAFNKRPFIVASRRNKKLLNTLLKDNDPILFEGLHTTWFLEHPAIQKRLTLVRIHNIEHEYYEGLTAKSTGFKRIYFQREAKKLQQYESILKKAGQLLCIREGDIPHFQQYNKKVQVLAASTPLIKPTAFYQTGDYVLFHGNLSVSENSKAVQWLIEEIWNKNELSLPFKIAGKNPSSELIELCEKNSIELIENPSHEELNELLINANTHLLVSDQPTGVKLKLLTALQTSGHVLVNTTMVEGTNLGELCTVCTSPDEFIAQLKRGQHTPLEMESFNRRQAFLLTYYSTEKNCLLFDDLIR